MITFENIGETLKKQEAAQREALIAEVNSEWAKFGRIIDRNLLRRVGYSGPSGDTDFISNHPAKPLSDKLDNVDQAFAILRIGREGLIATIGRFHGQVSYGIADAAMDEIMINATAQTFAYSAASASLIQAYRHLLSGNEAWKVPYDKLVTEIFGGTEISKFFSGLRNANSHVRILTAQPSYSVRFGDQGGVTVSIEFDKKHIVENKAWPELVRNFLKNEKDAHAVRLVNNHFKLAKEFNDKLPSRLGIFEDVAYQDLKTIRCAKASIGTLSTLALVLQVAMPKQLDPYAYLATWFSKDELERAFSLPNHSAEQVEFLIGIRDPLKLCNHSTREKLYTLFKVPTAPPKALSYF